MWITTRAQSHRDAGEMRLNGLPGYEIVKGESGLKRLNKIEVPLPMLLYAAIWSRWSNRTRVV